MSKIGRAPITIPPEVTCQISAGKISLTGKLGSLVFALPGGISADLKENTLYIKRANDSKAQKALHGLARALVNNMVIGVNKGFKKDLELIGTGYRARVAGNKLILNLGFSHEIEHEIPQNITITVEGTNLIHIEGINKHLVGQVAAIIRSYKKPEPYKGKGVRYLGENVRRKAGKAAKGAAA